MNRVTRDGAPVEPEPSRVLPGSSLDMTGTHTETTAVLVDDVDARHGGLPG